MWVFIVLDLFFSKRNDLKNLRFEIERSLQLLSIQYALTAAAATTAFGRFVCSYINDLYLYKRNVVVNVLMFYTMSPRASTVRAKITTDTNPYARYTYLYISDSV